MRQQQVSALPLSLLPVAAGGLCSVFLISYEASLETRGMFEQLSV